MIRKMLGLAFEAAKVELEHWRNPAPAFVEPVVEMVPAVNEAVEVSVTSAVTTPVASWRHSTKGHVDALAATACPDCGEAKQVGWYVCAACRPRKAAS